VLGLTSGIWLVMGIGLLLALGALSSVDGANGEFGTTVCGEYGHFA